MHVVETPIQAPPHARRPGPWEGRAGGPYVDRDEVGLPETPPPGLGTDPYDPPRGVPLRERPGSARTSWTFAAIGDYGSGGTAQARVAATLLARRPDFVATLGDNVYGFGLEHEYRRRWDPADRFGAIRSSVPVMPSLGNHDVRITPRAYFRRFPELGGARYYTFERGGVRFISIDSNQSLAPGSAQRSWLDGVLADSSAAAFRVLYMHHPLLSSQERGDGALLRDLAPALERGRVDLVLAGHEHHYERSRPINAYGTVHVTHGGGGKELHDFNTPPAWWSAARVAAHGFVEVEVRGGALVGRAIDDQGAVRDTFALMRGGAVGARGGAALLARQ